MKSNSKKIVILLILGLVFPLILNYNFNLSNDLTHKVDKPRTSATVDYIIIDALATTNTTFSGNWSWARAQPWCTTGDGTKEYPYIIENVIIINPPAIDCLTIRNSRKYFIVRNCTLKDIPVSSFSGLRLNSVTNAKIVDNQIYNNTFGIVCLNVNNSQIIDNNCSENKGDGIELENCYNNIISGNTVNLNNYGIDLLDCENNTISGNTACNNGQIGIDLDLSDNNTISGNTANNNGNSGIYIGQSDYITILRNYLKGNDYGVWMWYGDNNVITGNTANGNIIGLGYEKGENNTVSGNTVNNNTFSGIYISNNCNNSIITGNTANDNDDTGIYIEYACNNSTILGNAANNNGNSGIYFEGACNNSMISGNVLSNNNIGMYLDSNCDNNTIYENFFLKNGKHAIDNGIDNKWNSTTIGNYWDNHTGPDTTPLDGIVDTQYNISGTPGGIDYLPIAEDGAPQITINSPNDDDVIGSNSPSYDVTITDNSPVEMWYTLDGGLHNYTFTEFAGTIEQSAWDALSDGVITLTFYASDVPENIGSADVIVAKDTTSPIIVIVSPVDDEEYGTLPPLFNITITDDNLDSMWYSLDGGLTTHLITTNTSIDQTAWAALSDGLITITFYANDTLGYEASEDVLITKSIPPVGDDPTIVIVIVVVSIVGGVAVLAGVYIFMKKRGAP